METEQLTNPDRTGLTDPQGNKLFEAQWASGLWKRPRDQTTLAEAIAYADEVLNSPWVIENYGVFKVKIKPAFIRTEQIRGMAVIAIPYANIMLFTENGLGRINVLHELAHILNVTAETFYRNMKTGGKERPKKKGGSAHGVKFACIFLSLVRQFMPKENAESLEEQFKKHGIRYGKPHPYPIK